MTAATGLARNKQKMSSKTEREGRLHVTLLVWKGLGPTSGFYRYRLDFINEDACTRAADAMLKHHLRKAADVTRWPRWPQDAATKNADEAQAMRETVRERSLSLPLAETIEIDGEVGLDGAWIEAHRMAVRAPREQDEATRLTARLPPLIVFMQKAAHVVPVAFIQFTDFASDVLVVLQLHRWSNAVGASWIICVTAMGLSLLVAWFTLAVDVDGHLSCREKLVACVLACANLHVLYIGARFISAENEGQHIHAKRAKALYKLFVNLKMFETGLESIVVGMVTARAFFHTLDNGGSGTALFASSLVLSLLSMAYGFFGQAVNLYGKEIGRRRPALFLCLLAHLCWGLAAFGTLGAAAGGAWWLLGVGALVALASVRLFLDQRISGWPALLHILLFGLPLVLIDFEFLDFESLDDDSLDDDRRRKSGSSPRSSAGTAPDPIPAHCARCSVTDAAESGFLNGQKVWIAAARRALLFGVAATGVALAPNAASGRRLVVLVFLFLADLLCSPHAFRLIGITKWDPLSALLDKCIRLAATDPTPAAVPGSPKLRRRTTREACPTASGDYAALLDMLDAITKQCAVPNGSGAAGMKRPDGTDELGAEAEALRVAMRDELDALSPSALPAVVSAVGEYKPWEEGAQRLLVDKLRSRRGTALAEPSAARLRVTHPLRALPLAEGLTSEVWATTPSFFGGQPKGTNYDLSVDASHVDYFVRARLLAPPHSRTLPQSPAPPPPCHR